MSTRINLIWPICCLMLVGCTTTKVGSPSKATIAVTIPYGSTDTPDSTKNRRHADVGTASRTRFHVLLTNVSNKPIRIWQEWCSWGYSSLQLEIIDADGTIHLLKKKPIAFFMNAPDYVVLAPGDSVVWDVELNTKVWEGLSWLPEDKISHVKIRAIYTVEEDEDSKERHVWTGQATSTTFDFNLD